MHNKKTRNSGKLPLGGVKMTIEPYNYNDEPSGRTETLIQALDKIERLEKQLKIAVEALENYSQIGYYNVAQRALFEIEELEK